MKKRVKFKFVNAIPDSLDEGIVYISTCYNTALHKCICGCGNEVVTPLSPSGWELFYNGEEISLYPSIGNWNFKCQSHYWIIRNKVIWAKKWSKKQIEYNKSFEIKSGNKLKDRTIREKTILVKFFEFFQF